MAERFSPHFVAVAKKVGGSLMRVQRDTRFVKNAEPYKTNIGIQFRHSVGKDVHAPGLYIHVAPDECSIGAGVWHPEAPLLKKNREQIALTKRELISPNLVELLFERFQRSRAFVRFLCEAGGLPF